MNPIFAADIVKGKLFIKNRRQFDDYIASQAGKMIVVVRKDRKNRSDDQNRYYWGVIIDILGNHFGYTPDEMHEAIKLKFLRKKIGRGPETVGSTTVLDTKEFSELVDKIIIWAQTEFDVKIPLPNEVEV